MAANKTYLYKVYDEQENFIRVWDDVISDFSISEEINTSGSQVKVVLARPADDFGEGLDVDFDLIVKIFAVDADNPNGTQVFNGYIASYTPKFGDQESIEINVLGFGARLDGYIIQAGESIDSSQTSGAIGFNSGYYLPGPLQSRSNAQSFTIVSTGLLSRIVCKLYGPTGVTVAAQLILRSGTPNATENWGYASEGNYVAQATVNVSTPVANAFAEYSFVFATPVSVVAGEQYWFEVQTPYPVGGEDLPGYPGQFPIVTVACSDAGGYAGGQQYYGDKYAGTGMFTTSSYTVRSGYDLWFEVYETTGSTTAAYASYDPSDILRSIIDDYSSRGGELSYDADSIDDTGTVVTYTFNTNTVWEGMKKCLELAPAGWYLYIDQATNLVHFHQKASTVQNKIVLGKDILELSPEKRTEDIVNTVYFTGGGDPPLFNVYTADESIELYGERIKRYIDQRVTVDSTAQAIATAILDQYKAPELRLNVVVADNAGDGTKGIDTEALTIGDTIGVRNVDGSGPSLWDVSAFDVDYWDYNVQDLSSPILQIVRLERSPDKVSIYCSTVPPDVSKRIEDINRNLEATQTKDNPSVPA